MTIVGHWANLAEAQKLTQSELQEGIIETVIKAGGLIATLPVRQIEGVSLKYNREKSFTASAAAQFLGIRQQLVWTSDIDYDQIETTLTRVGRQDPLDNFVAMTYKSINDYRATEVQQLTKRVAHFMDFYAFYGDSTYGVSSEFDGLHALAAEQTGTDNDIDMGEAALSLNQMRLLADAVKVEPLGRQNVEWRVPRVILRRLSAGYEEAGLVGSGVTHSMSSGISITKNEAGGRLVMFDDIPIVATDFLEAEQANTGVGSDARALNTSGTNQYSIFLVRKGLPQDGGLFLGFGGDASFNVAELFKLTHFDKLENFDSEGFRLISYPAIGLGATHSLGRIYDITDAAIVP